MTYSDVFMMAMMLMPQPGCFGVRAELGRSL